VKALGCIDRMLDFVKRNPGAVAQARAGFVPHVGSA
jgi:quinolinate synthase